MGLFATTDFNEKKKSILSVSAWLYAPIKIAICCALLYFFDWGIFLVFGYLIWSLERSSAYQYINTLETNHALHGVHVKIEQLAQQIELNQQKNDGDLFELGERIAHLEESESKW